MQFSFEQTVSSFVMWSNKCEQIRVSSDKKVIDVLDVAKQLKHSLFWFGCSAGETSAVDVANSSFHRAGSTIDQHATGEGTIRDAA